MPPFSAPLTSGEATRALVKPVTRLCARLLFGNTFVTDASGELADALAKKMGKSEADLAFEKLRKLGETVTQSLEPLFNENTSINFQAVADAVTETLDKVVNLQFLLDNNLDDKQVTTALRNSRTLPQGWFGDDEAVLYDRALTEIGTQLVELAPKLSNFYVLFGRAVLSQLDTAADTIKEVLAQFDAILDELATIANSEAVKFARYEKLYLKTIRENLDYMELFGAEIDPTRAHHPLLSIAYISLHLRQGEGVEAQNLEAAKFFDTLNEDVSKLLIEGEAGGGKSTLMRWVAMEAARCQLGLNSDETPSAREITQGSQTVGWITESLGGELTFRTKAKTIWQNRIPFLIRLRGLDTRNYTLPPLDQVPQLEADNIGNPPEGWMQSLVEKQRALFLIDGIDEVPDDKRYGLMRTLHDYFNNDGNCFVITSRPAATRNWTSWREDESIGRAYIKDLSPPEAKQLVYTWHNAIRTSIGRSNVANKQNQLDRLEGIEESLLAKIETHESLASLMVNPLLCSMICALHWWKNRQLPQNLIELCEDLCKILIQEKAQLSGVNEDEFPSRYGTLSYGLKRRLVQSIAVDMVTPKWQSEISWLDAERVTENTMQGIMGMEGEDKRDTLTTMVTRCGVLRERSGVKEDIRSSRLEFVHNTFKEHLAADWLVQKQQQVLLRNLSNPDWRNILILASANERDEEIGRKIIEGLLKTSDRRNHLFALKCRTVIQYRVDDLDVRLDELKEQFFPPNDEEEADAIGAIGNAAVPNLGWREELTTEQAVACVSALGKINTSAARDVARGYVEDERVFDELVRVVNPLWIPKVVHELTSGEEIQLQSIRQHWRHQISDLSPLTNLEQLHTLDLSGTQVSDLGPIQNLRELQSLHLNRTLVSDLSPLTSLEQLQTLLLSETQVRDLSPLTSLEQLQTLNLSAVQVSDLSPLANLSQLESLHLNSTQVSDIGPLMNLDQLQVLNLSESQVSDLSPLINLEKLYSLDVSKMPLLDTQLLSSLLHLRTLNLSDSQISDLNPVQNLGKIQSLHLDRTQVSDLSPVQNLGELQNLYLDRTLVSDLSPLTSLEQLRTLNLSETQVSDLSPLTSLLHLQTLTLSETQVSDLSSLKNLTELQSLRLKGTQVRNLSPLANLRQLQLLNLSGTQISDLHPLRNLSELRALDLSSTHISNLEGITSLKNLSIITLASTQISDISPLSLLTDLWYIDLASTQIRDLSPLSKLPSIKTIILNEEAKGRYTGLGTVSPQIFWRKEGEPSLISL